MRVEPVITSGMFTLWMKCWRVIIMDISKIFLLTYICCNMFTGRIISFQGYSSLPTYAATCLQVELYHFKDIPPYLYMLQHVYR